MSQKVGTLQRIGEHDYTMYMLAPMISHDLFIDVLKMVGPALGPVVDALLKQGETKDLTGFLQQDLGVDFFTKAASSLFGGLDKKILAATIAAFRTVSFVDEKPLDGIFDEHFRGDLGGMYQWLLWGMRVQWGKSLSALGSAVVAQGAAALAAVR